MKNIRKPFCISAAFLIFAFLFASCGQVKAVNAYDRVYNEVLSIKNGERSSFLLTDGSYVDLDLGFFDSVQFPDNHAALTIADGRLRIFIFPEERASSDAVCFVYDPKTKTLVGNEEEAYLYENLLNMFCEEDELGKCTYLFSEYPQQYE